MKRISEFFGEYTFNKEVMRQKLNKQVYLQLINTIENEEPLDQSIAANVAHAMKEWAIENGATHFTHWFQPRRGGTAEKHDSFISYDERGDIIERFSDKQLIQSEPDASSFPSGGIRSTFEARGYTAWDPGSPAFLLKSGEVTTLIIPSVFLSFTGEILDLKTPMLRSQKALNESCIILQRLLGNRLAKRVRVYSGIEQEYFLISRSLYDTRPDLRICGRTLFGAAPAKGQQMDDHYFGSIKDKVMKFMDELDMELYKKGIPAKTRHNEAAPNQFEIAPLYEQTRLAIDHNLQLMDTMVRIGHKNGFKVLLKEKPFAGVNGSGKHFNWSIGDDTTKNYLKSSKSPLKNINFLMTIAAILLGVSKYGGLIRAAVATANNDYRLGAHEAPPAIMSVYLGEYLSGILDEIEGIRKLTEKNMAQINLGVQNLPRVAKDISDRNRTSPIAFTGDKFEFRAVGSSQNCAEIATVINCMMADGYNEIYQRLKKMTGNVKTNAILVLKEILKETKHVRFEGNNYCQAWKDEAAVRHLPNAVNTPQALEYFLKKEAIELFSAKKVFSERELQANIEIKVEEYCKIKELEFKTAVYMVKTLFMPAVVRYLSIMSNTCENMADIGVENNDLKDDVALLSSYYSQLKHKVNRLTGVLENGSAISDHLKKAHYYAEQGEIELSSLRQVVDQAEIIVAEDIWPMAKYQELLTKL
jgi:glutamine synthetase